MFFSGDPSARKRVDMGGRSSKERDRQKLLDQARLERNQRLWLRQQNSAALKIQKCFRGRRAVEAKKGEVREEFLSTYGNRCQNVDRFCFGPESDFLRLLIFFFNAQNACDFSILVETCGLLQEFVLNDGDIVSLFAGTDYSSQHDLVDYKVKSIAYACIRSLHRSRYQLTAKVWISSEKSSFSTLLKAVLLLLDPKLPWVCQIIGHLVQRNIFTLLREIILAMKESEINICCSSGIASSLEQVLVLIISHFDQRQCICPEIDPRQSFSSLILSVPFLWKLFPELKAVFSTGSLSKHYIQQMALCVKNHANVLPSDTSNENPSHACLLGNILEAAPAILSQRDCSVDLAIEFAGLTSFLLRALPPLKSLIQSRESTLMSEEEMAIDDEVTGNVLSIDLGKQISNAIDSRFLLQLINVLFREISLINGSFEVGADDYEDAAVGSACAFLEVTFNILPLERIMTVLAYRTELVPVLWKYMKRCHENQRWSSLPGKVAHLSADAPGWLLPLAVFCPVYKHMLTIVDNEEFYEQEKPLSLKDISSLIVILRQALWQLLWVDATAPATVYKSVSDVSVHGRNPQELSHRVSTVASELLSQLQDWNNRREFTPPSDFHADGANEQFITQAGVEGSKSYVILKQAPFLVPFSIRANIFISQLMAVRHRNGNHDISHRNRFKIRRDHILEDAFNQLNALSEEDLRELIRVSFVNEFGVEEAGIDGGGIFKDFMENITRSAYDVQYGLFKETSDHLLYPNPASGIVHEQHLQFFHFLGTILAKAMFEGILVDIPFATFFLSKLKHKYNYLNDLPSLDPELYRHLIFLKHYKGDISGLELYFVIVNNEYGVQTEEELLPGGKNMRVTNENVITFIHLIANHRLNFQIRQQSSYFLRGFQQLIQKEWIDMFNEHELQLLISGALDHLDVDDLRKYTNYTGGYHGEHYVIQVFWEVLKSFSLENQMKFMKFVTGCSRGPLLGFRYLEPLFCIQRAAGSVTEEALQRLPTSATCMNLLKLPPYTSKEQMEAKLLYAISADAGFDLS